MGPRVLLAFCHFYKRELRQLTLPTGVHIIDTFTLSRTVAQHLPLAYKHRGARFNRTVRYEWLSQYYWSNLEEVQAFATQWMWSYNNDRPHMALGGFTPRQKLAMAA